MNDGKYHIEPKNCKDRICPETGMMHPMGEIGGPIIICQHIDLLQKMKDGKG